MRYHCNSVFISDLHLGTSDCQAKRLLEFLRTIRCQQLYLVGDIVDLWSMKKRPSKFGKAQLEVVRCLLKHARRGTQIYYVTGNHDEDFRHILKDYPFETGINNICLCNTTTHTTAAGERLVVMHGDQFDAHTRCHKLLEWTGDTIYYQLLKLNRWVNQWRERSGKHYWSLSQFLKHKASRAREYIDVYERAAADYARRKGFDGIVCGHIHKANVRKIAGVTYYNDGDWVESCTAIIEHRDGRIELIQAPQWLAQLPRAASEKPAAPQVA